MKKLTLIFLLLLVLFFNGISQDTTIEQTHNLLIKNNLLITTIGFIKYPRVVNFAFEKSIKPSHSIQFSFLYGIYPKDVRDIHKDIQIVSEYRKYLKQNSNLSGFYIGTYLKFLYKKSPYTFEIPNETLIINYENLYLGPNVGFQNKIYKNLYFDFLIGTGYRIGLNGDYFVSRKFDFRANISLGYKF